MKTNKILSVYKKEIKETLRDKKTLFSMIGIPLLLYPVLMIGLTQVISIGQDNVENQTSAIAFKTRANADLLILLESEPKIRVTDSADAESDLKAEKIQAFVETETKGEKETFTLNFDASSDMSRQAADRLKPVLERYGEAKRDKALEARGLSPAVLDVFSVTEKNTASDKKMGGMLLGMIIPLMLIMTIFIGAMYPAIDLTAGEKERGTLETILSLPVTKTELFCGKYLTVATTAVISGVLNVISMLLVYMLALAQMDMMKGSFQIALSFQAVALVLLLSIPLSFFISAVVLSVSLFAKSFKEAQNYVTPVMILLILPSYAGMMPGIELNTVLAMVPVINISLLLKDILMEVFKADMIFLVFASNILFAFLGVFCFSRIFNSEAILFSDGKNLHFDFKRKNIRPVETLSASTAMTLYAVIILLMIYAGSLVQMKLGLTGVLITEWLLILGPVLLVLWFFKADIVKSLHISGFNPSHFAGAFLLWAGAFVWIVGISGVLSRWFPQIEQFGKQFSDLLTGQTADGSALILAILIVAVSPAICEEALFRGLLLSSFKKKMKPVFAIVSVALLFGLFHLDLIRLVPTALLGIVLTYITYSSGSIFLSMIIHCVNNLVAILSVFNPAGYEAVTNAFTGNDLAVAVLFGAAAVSMAGGVMILKKGK